MTTPRRRRLLQFSMRTMMSIVTVIAVLVGHAGRPLYDSYRRWREQNKVLDSLAQVEFSLIPFPDDEPMGYPDAARWQELDLRRRKWLEFKSAAPASAALAAQADRP
jgi:hypothetical protein